MTSTNSIDSFLFMNINASTVVPTSSILSDDSSNRNLSSYDKNNNDSESLNIVERLTTHVTLIVSIIGLIGNLCTIIVLNRRSMRKWRSSMLLSALAIVDFLYLLIIFLSIVDALTDQAIGLNQSIILCQTTVYITHICSFLSASFTLSFTLQRFVAVIFPLHANKIISKRSSIFNILLLIAFGCSFYSFSFLLTNVTHGQCREDESYPALFPLLIVDTCLTFVIPFTFILVFNCAIVYKLRKRKQLALLHFGGSFAARTSSRKYRKSSSIRLSGCEFYHERKGLSQTNLTDNDTVLLRNEDKTSNDVVTSGNLYARRLSEANPSTTVITIELKRALSNTNSNPSQHEISQRTTMMLVICSTTFLLFNSPYCAVLLYSIISKDVLIRTLGILRHFYFMSFCLNFFLYSLCGHRFRRELLLVFQECCQKCGIKQKYRLKRVNRSSTI